MIKRSRWYYSFKIWYWSRKIINIFFKAKSLWWYIAVLIAVVAFILWMNIRSRIYSAHYRIDKVVFSPESVQHYNDIELFDRIAHVYSGWYYSTLRLGSNQWAGIAQLLNKYSYVQSIAPQSFENNTLLVSVQFQEPVLKFRYIDRHYAIYKDKTILPLSDHDTLWRQSPLILLPLYLSGSSASISGVLYQVDVEKMLYDYLLLQTSPIQWSLTYIPGGEKYVIWNPEQRVYLNAKKDIAGQLHILNILKNNYGEFHLLKQIDVWSLSHPIVK